MLRFVENSSFSFGFRIWKKRGHGSQNENHLRQTFLYNDPIEEKLFFERHIRFLNNICMPKFSIQGSEADLCQRDVVGGWIHVGLDAVFYLL